jgi:hypothetical protein
MVLLFLLKVNCGMKEAIEYFLRVSSAGSLSAVMISRRNVMPWRCLSCGSGSKSQTIPGRSLVSRKS